MQIAGVRVAWVGTAPCGLLMCVSRGWRRAMRIADVRVVWVALCHGDCWCACRVGGVVPWGLLVGVSCGWRCMPCGLLVCVSRGWRCAMGIAGVRVAWVALCYEDCWWACRVGSAVPWGLLVCVSGGWRCAMGIAGGRVVWVALYTMRVAGVRVAWVALCHGDCWRACRVGGAVPWRLLVGVSRG